MRLPIEAWWQTWQRLLLEANPVITPAQDPALQDEAKALVEQFQQFRRRLQLERVGIRVWHGEGKRKRRKR
jgi:hypothetical protein